jgi:hypothetical protein
MNTFRSQRLVPVLVCLFVAAGCGSADDMDGEPSADDVFVDDSTYEDDDDLDDSSWADDDTVFEGEETVDDETMPDDDTTPDDDVTDEEGSGETEVDNSGAAAKEGADSITMNYVTANIGRNYGSQAKMRSAVDNVGDVIGPKKGPRFIGWQEIGEGDPCGKGCEIAAIRDRFKKTNGWATRRPNGQRPNGSWETPKVPITFKGANDNVSARSVFASPGWSGVSPTRFVTVTHHPQRNLSIVNTHLIAGAWSCKSHVQKRREYWSKGWKRLKAEVAKEHAKGRNVIVTGDLNRPRGSNKCNPKWDPTSLHPRAKIVGGASIDYIFAVPASGRKFAVSVSATGTKRRGSIFLGIDGHKAHWVRGRFLKS